MERIYPKSKKLCHTTSIDQCSEFLKSLPDVKVTIFENTATAAKYVAECDREDIAAIASEECANLYGLQVMKDDIQNNQNNYTRFICIAKNMEIYAGSSKISLMLSVAHHPGSLYRMLGKIAAKGINLSPNWKADQFPEKISNSVFILTWKRLCFRKMCRYCSKIWNVVQINFLSLVAMQKWCEEVEI